MNPKLAGVSLTALLDELTRRLFKLQHDAGRVDSVASLRVVIDEAFKAGCSAGKLAQLSVLSSRLQRVLDEAVAKAPAPEAAEFEREYRRALFSAIGQAQVEIDAHIRAESAAASALRERVERLVADVLRPERPLRARLGQWLYAFGDRIAAVRPMAARAP